MDYAHAFLQLLFRLYRWKKWSVILYPEGSISKHIETVIISYGSVLAYGD